VHVADHDQRAERELAAALDHLGHAVDAHDSVGQLRPLAARVRVPRSHALKLQSGFSGSVRQSLDSAVIQETTPVEHHRAHTCRLRLGGDRLAYLGGLGHAVALGLEVDRGGGRKRVAAAVVDQLRIDMVEAAVDREPRAFLRADDVYADPAVALQAAFLAIGLLDHPAAFAPLPALPALRRIFSPRYMTPLPLYGSGGRRPRMLAATCPTSSIEIPVTANFVWSWTSMVTPGGGLNLIGCE